MSYFKCVIENNAIVIGNNKITVTQENRENCYSILSSTNKAKLDILKKFHSEFDYKPNTILLGITAPKCNLDCEFCLRKYNPHFNTPETDLQELDYILDNAIKAGVNISLVFFNNEAFNAENQEWQFNIAELIEKHKSNIGSIMFFTNGIDLQDGFNHPLLEYATKVYDPENKRVKVCLAINVDIADGNESHITIHNNYKKHIDYIKRYIPIHFEVNLLYDINSNIDYTALEGLLNYLKSDGVPLKASVIIRETSSEPTIDMDKLSTLFSKYDTGNYGKLTGIYSQFSNAIPVPMDGPPNYAIVNNKSIRGITSGKEYIIEDHTDILNAMDRYIFEAFPAFDKCSTCDGDCNDLVLSGQCKAKLIEKCLTCPIFGDCSGFFCEGNMQFRPCCLEVFDLHLNMAAKLKTILRSGITAEELKAELDKKLLNKCYTGLINKSFRRKRND